MYKVLMNMVNIYTEEAGNIRKTGDGAGFFSYFMICAARVMCATRVRAHKDEAQ